MQVVHPTADVHATARILGRGNVQIGAYCSVEAAVVIDLGTNRSSRFVLGSRSKLKTGTIIKCYGNAVLVGHRVTIGDYSTLSGHGGLEIGDYTITGSYCVLHAAAHLTQGPTALRLLGESAAGISVGKDCWFGANVTILDGVTIGDHVIIGAGSVVTRSVGTCSVAYGVPARVRGKRDMEEQ